MPCSLNIQIFLLCRKTEILVIFSQSMNHKLPGIKIICSKRCHILKRRKNIFCSGLPIPLLKTGCIAQSALNPRMKVREHIDAVLSACGRRGSGGGRGAVPETGSFRGAFFQISQYAVRGAEAEDRDRACDVKETGASFYG